MLLLTSRVTSWPRNLGKKERKKEQKEEREEAETEKTEDKEEREEITEMTEEKTEEKTEEIENRGTLVVVREGVEETEIDHYYSWSV